MEGTEVLTPAGWLPVEWVKMDTQLVQWHDDNTLSWTKPVKLSAHVADYYYEFSLPSRGYKQVVSANHRYPYYTKDGNLKVIAAREATPNHYSKHPMTGALRSWSQDDGLTALERFLVALQADGSLPSDRYTGANCGTVPYCFTFAKQRKIDAFEKILADLSLTYVKARQPDGKYTYRVNGPIGLTKDFYDWLELASRSLSWCRAFIVEIGEWDGHVVKENPARITYSSVNKDNVDAVQAVASLAGYRTKYTRVVDSRSETYNDIHRLFINRHQDKVMGGRIEKSMVKKLAFMYGIEVPSSFLLIRRDNCVSVTGNSQHIGFGQALIKEYMAQYPACLTEDFLRQIEQDTRKAVELEKEYIAYCLKDGPILGYSVNEHVATAKFFANMRLGAVGLPQPFEDAYHAFPWMAEQMELNKEKAFFEVRVVDYQAGGALSFDEASHHEGWDDPLEGLK
jgi:ribonucleotide reductase beta subunit family protein with ferritin-like domain